MKSGSLRKYDLQGSDVPQTHLYFFVLNYYIITGMWIMEKHSVVYGFGSDFIAGIASATVCVYVCLHLSAVFMLTSVYCVLPVSTCSFKNANVGIYPVGLESTLKIWDEKSKPPNKRNVLGFEKCKTTKYD